MSKNLVIYYSRTGENYWNGSIKNISKGNTERVAEFIKDAVGADLFKVETVKSYSNDYYECCDEAKKELHAGARPEIKEKLKSIAEYDNIFIGYPIWWGTMPMCMFTALEGLDFSGKTVIPFATHEGSGLSGSERDVKNLCVGATVKKGLAIHGADAERSEKTVAAWAKESIN